MTSTQSFQIVTFGPHRAIGMRYTGKAEKKELTELWEKFIPHACGESAPLMQGGCVGVCRCVPGKTDGTMDYVAAFLAKPGASVPSGMVEVDLPAGDYAVFPVPELDQCQAVWQSSYAQLEASEWVPYCTGPEACDCANHPSFEHYPPEYRGCGPFSIYISVKRK